MNNTNKLLFALLVILNGLDFISTKIIVDSHGYDLEANPLLQLMMGYTDSSWSILLVKIAALTFAYFMFDVGFNRGYAQNRARNILIVLNTIFTIVVINNFLWM